MSYLEGLVKASEDWEKVNIPSQASLPERWQFLDHRISGDSNFYNTNNGQHFHEGALEIFEFHCTERLDYQADVNDLLSVVEGWNEGSSSPFVGAHIILPCMCGGSILHYLCVVQP